VERDGHDGAAVWQRMRGALLDLSDTQFKEDQVN